MSASPTDRKNAAALVVGAIGVVYGDIGTSPLYMLRTAFTGEHGLAVTPDNVYGVLSAVFWSLIVVVTLKYIALIMRADNNGEGGILALTALVSRGLAKHERRRWWLVGFGIFGEHHVHVGNHVDNPRRFAFFGYLFPTWPNQFFIGKFVARHTF